MCFTSVLINKLWITTALTQLVITAATSARHAPRLGDPVNINVTHS